MFAYTAHETNVADRAHTWVPKNVLDLAKIDRAAARNLLAEVASELLASEPIMDIVTDPISLVPELRLAIGLRTDERFAAVFLDNAGRVLLNKVYEGGSRTKTVLYPRQLFKDALAVDATGVVLAHNHPAGSLLPSLADRELTKRVRQLGEQLEVSLVDHLIITATGHTSFVENGWV